MDKLRIEHHTFPSLWVLGWFFTIGFLRLGFVKAVLALLLWAYYLGVHFRGLGR